MGHRQSNWLAFLLLFGTSCSSQPVEGPPDAGTTAQWALVHEDLPGALLSIWGTSDTDVWVVGADARDGAGPLVLHYDGQWQRVMTGQAQGDLWWVFGFDGGPLYMGGSGGVILRYEGGTFTKLQTPTMDTVFGLWGASPDDMWAVGGTYDKNAFAWRLQGDTWVNEPTLPSDVGANAAIWKIFGTSKNDAWLVGSGGVSFHWDGSKLTPGQTGVGSSLFTVHANGDRYVAVGGLVSGVIVENAGSGWTLAASDTIAYGLTGVFLGAGDAALAVGQYGSVYSRSANGWQEDVTGLSIQWDLHGAWMDPSGGLWAAGGQTASFPLTKGLLLHKGKPIVGGGI